jgi:hypothetical protein
MSTRFFRSVECQTTLPVEIPDVPDAEIERFVGGEAIAHILSDWLKAGGFETSAPEVEEGHYWGVSATCGGRTFLVAVTQPGPSVIIQTQETSFFARQLVGGRSIHRKLVQFLHGKLRDDPRFHSLRWYPFGFDGRDKGAPEPFVQAG